jgi:4-amino-4-deoxy-L-arabinose transferase-like glycosyltransferase
LKRIFWEILLLVFILLLALGLRIAHYTGPIGSDDQDYYLAAYDIYQGHYQPSDNYWKNRFGMVLPIAASYELFGTNEYAADAWPMLASVGAIFICFLLGKKLLDVQTGLLGALLLAFYPLDIHYSGLILPDIPLSFLMAGSVFAFISATGSAKYSAGLYFLSGLLLGVAYSCRSMAVILLPVFVLYIILFDRKPRPGYLLFAAGLILIPLLEGWYYYQSGLTPLHNILLNKEAALQVNAAGECSTSQLYYPNAITKNLSVFGPYFYLFVPALILALVKRKRGALILALWAGILLIILQFGVVSIHPLIQIVKVRKFLNFVTVPLVLLGAWALVQLRLQIRTAVIILLFGASLFLLRPYRYAANSTPEASGSYIRYAAKYLEEVPPKPIYADLRTQAMLMISSQFKLQPERFRNLYEVRSPYELRDCYVVINGFYAKFDAAAPWADVPQFVAHYPESIPRNWKAKDFFFSAVYTVP